MTKTWHLR